MSTKLPARRSFRCPSLSPSTLPVLCTQACSTFYVLDLVLGTRLDSRAGCSGLGPGLARSTCAGAGQRPLISLQEALAFVVQGLHALPLPAPLPPLGSPFLYAVSHPELSAVPCMYTLLFCSGCVLSTVLQSSRNWVKITPRIISKAACTVSATWCLDQWENLLWKLLEALESGM